jgi:RNA polymerase sigma factor (sigma-70 family)
MDDPYTFFHGLIQPWRNAKAKIRKLRGSGLDNLLPDEAASKELRSMRQDLDDILSRMRYVCALYHGYDLLHGRVAGQRGMTIDEVKNTMMQMPLWDLFCMLDKSVRKITTFAEANGLSPGMTHRLIEIDLLDVVDKNYIFSIAKAARIAFVFLPDEHQLYQSLMQDFAFAGISLNTARRFKNKLRQFGNPYAVLRTFLPESVRFTLVSAETPEDFGRLPGQVARRIETLLPEPDPVPEYPLLEDQCNPDEIHDARVKDPLEEFMAREDVRQAWRKFEETKIPPREREAFLLHVVGGLTETETAERMGVTVGTIRSWRARTARRLSA